MIFSYKLNQVFLTMLVKGMQEVSHQYYMERILASVDSIPLASAELYPFRPALNLTQDLRKKNTDHKHFGLAAQ